MKIDLSGARHYNGRHEAQEAEGGTEGGCDPTSGHEPTKANALGEGEAPRT